MTILTTLFVILLCVALYHHIGYPLLLKCVSTKKVKPVKPAQYDEKTLPNIAILMCAYNEQAHIAEKLHNLASLVYDTNHYTIHVYFDGCTDKSYQQALKAQQVLHKQGVKCFFHFRDENQGKVQGLNTLMGVAKYHNDILLFTDVSALLSIDALDKVAQQFSDPKVAISTGVYTLNENAPDAQKAYWQYQNKVKKSESNLGAVIGVPGAMFAMRAE